MKHRGELLRLLSDLCEGQLSDADHHRLEELLAGDAEGRRVYLQYLDMHARLLADTEAIAPLKGLNGLAALINPEGPAAEQMKPSRVALSPASPWWKVRRMASYVAVAAATLAATMLIQFWMGRRVRVDEAQARAPVSGSYVATLSQAASVRWGAATEAYWPGARVLSGEFELRSGVARLGYEGGVELIVEGPARLMLEGSSAATLLTGKVVFRGDDASSPFTLSTPSSILIDLGTEYAVEVGAQQEEVHVFSGEVQRLPKMNQRPTQPELLAAGEARRYGDGSAGTATTIEPSRFVRQVPRGAAAEDDVSQSLLAYEGFNYPDSAALKDETANAGSGFIGPWGGGFARGVNEKRGDRIALDVQSSLSRANQRSDSVGGSFSHAGFAKYFRRLKTPIRLDADGVYYFSFLLRREGPPLDPLNDVSLQLRETAELARDQEDATTDLRKRLNFGVDRTNELFTHLERIGRRMPLPLSYGETYLLIAKIVASTAHSDQVYLRVYGPQEPVDESEPANWSAVGPPIESDLVFDWLEIHINSQTQQTIDEIRIGTTWEAVATTWMSKLRPQTE